MQTKLPINQKSITFFAKGDFFLNRLILDGSIENGLIAKDSAIERISRFSQPDLQEHIENYQKRAGSKVLLFSKEFDYRQNPDWAYIKREKTPEIKSFEVLAKIYGARDIWAANLSFKEVSLIKYSAENSKLEIKTEKLDLKDAGSALRNNFLFDPYIDFSKHSEVGQVVIKAFERLFEGAKIPEMIILMGEFIWVNYLGNFLEKLVTSDHLGFNVLIDQDGLWEAVLSETPEESELRFLRKENFHRNLIRVEKIAKDKTIEIKSGNPDVPSRILRVNPKKWIYSEFGKDETYDRKHYSGIVFGREGGLKSIPVLDKKVKYRADKMFEYYEKELKIAIPEGEEAMLKVFDYASLNPLAGIKLEVIDGEKVRKNQRLAKYREIGGLLDKRIVSSTDGRIDLGNLKRGYIKVIEEGRTAQKRYKHYYKLRAKLVLGNSWQGDFSKNGVYVSNLYKNDFELFVQKAKKVVITDSIDLELFDDIVDFELGSIMTVVILGGIDVNASPRPKFLKKDNLYLDVNSTSREVLIGANETENALTSLNENRLRVDQSVRIIDTVYWGDCATIVSQKNGKIGLKTNVHVDQVSPLNLI